METPVYQIVVSDVNELNAISLVETAAIDANFLAFSEEQTYAFSREDYRQVVTGPALIPNYNILRYDADRNPYYVYFTEDVIRQLVTKYFARGNTSYNVSHSDNLLANSVTIESWFVGKGDKSTDYGFAVPQGTWMLSVYIPDTDFFNDQILSGKITGFSVEGLFAQKLDGQDEEKAAKEALDQLIALLG